MITFACPGCGKSFMVPDEFGGRTAKCKQCGGPVTVPAVRGRDNGVATALANGGGIAGKTRENHGGFAGRGEAIDPALGIAPASNGAGVAATGGSGTSLTSTARTTAASKTPMRLRRLRADADEMARLFTGSPFIRVLEAVGQPAELYKVEYHVQSLEPGPGGHPKPRDKHVVQIQLTSEYPRSSPTCKMLTPIFHPNIDLAGICIGDHWAAGERLADLVVRIGEMLAYQAYNIRSPLDAEAAMWADLHQAQLPTDPRDFHPPVG